MGLMELGAIVGVFVLAGVAEKVDEALARRRDRARVARSYRAGGWR